MWSSLWYYNDTSKTSETESTDKAYTQELYNGKNSLHNKKFTYFYNYKKYTTKIKGDT